ncbi:MAG: inorganic phosphate transporter [Phocaeicola sp.]
MSTIFLVILLLLLLLASLDLIVGVANDAVNFLNSAIGSAAAPRYIILGIASVGILVGVLTSSGMMEIARSGVFNPAMFPFSAIMWLFLAVMITDVLLLDLFNSLGLPTSTTVSLVFELLGAAVCVALFQIGDSPEHTLADLPSYINSAKALGMITGILSSVAIAFVAGSLVMYLARLLFTFNEQKRSKAVEAVVTGLALTAISYYALFKGLKNTPLIPDTLLDFVSSNLWISLLSLLAVWSLLMYLLARCRVNPFRITVLAGTFALALAFAGNDLVNFIGVFLAGYDAYHLADSAGNSGMMMGDLMQPVQANWLMLLVSGAIMVCTLWFSRKARKVTETEVDLARQEVGMERFGSTLFSRTLVRSSLVINKMLGQVTPPTLQRMVSARFEPSPLITTASNSSFDLIRASVNLTVAALLISLATSLKLPLSTTYVTFMVAMGSSLADRAWGRESAVYRITGVMTVISGWFFTALMAFVLTFLVAALLMWGEGYALLFLIPLAGYLLYRSMMRSKREEKQQTKEKKQKVSHSPKELVKECATEMAQFSLQLSSVYHTALEAIFQENRILLKQALEQSRALYLEASDGKRRVVLTLNRLVAQEVETGHYYVQVVDYLDEVAKSLLQISKSCYEHLANNHEGFSPDQVADLQGILSRIDTLFSDVNRMIEANDFSNMEGVLALRDAAFEEMEQAIKHQLIRTQLGTTGMRSSMLYLTILSESKVIILNLRNLLKAQKHFLNY